MKYIFIAGIVLLSLSLSFKSFGACFYKETLTVGTSTAIGISDVAKDPTLKYALISVEDADIRFWYDGNSPTISVGHLLLHNNMIGLEGQNNLRNLRIISAGTTSAKVRLSYEN